MAVGDLTTFSYTGAVQTMQLLAGHRYIFECLGAQGASPDPARIDRQGGLGGYVWGVYEPSQDETINIYVGQQPSGATGGWNGGGNGGACGGGGASDIRSGGTALSNRLLVAGGGGGGSPNESYKQQGAAGGTTGAVGANWNGTNKYGLGGTQSAGGSNGGALGIGGAATDGFWTGGGGGGYYGGGGATGMACGGGGGSSWFGGVLLGGSKGQYNEGHGKVYVTEVSTTKLTTETTFAFTGHPQTARLKKGKYRVSCYGAQGGYSANQPTNIPGKGGYCAADVEITSECYILVMAGGSGSTRLGGWNGGGIGGKGGMSVAGGGGGASDIRINGGSLTDRILIAGGGGGGQTVILGGVPTSGVQGAGGGLTGTNGKQYNVPEGPGGTQSAAGTGGGLGFGVDGEVSGGYDTPGGGGGYYGGGKGGNYSQSGGGSSFYGSLLNPVTTAGLRTGNGYIVITPLVTPRKRRLAFAV